MPRPRPTVVYHFTHIRNLPGIMANGLLCDIACQGSAATQVSVGAAGIKAWRRRRVVPSPPGGVVGDYVPFYFAPRSPMMFTLGRNNYEYHGGFQEVVYLTSSLERLSALDCDWIASDRNAALNLATFMGPGGNLDAHVDWPLMTQQQWGRTDADPERPERRAAECLVRDMVPFAAIERIVAKTNQTRLAVEQRLGPLAASVPASVRRDWYF